MLCQCPPSNSFLYNKHCMAAAQDVVAKIDRICAICKEGKNEGGKPLDTNKFNSQFNKVLHDMNQFDFHNVISGLNIMMNLLGRRRLLQALRRPREAGAAVLGAFRPAEECGVLARAAGGALHRCAGGVRAAAVANGGAQHQHDGDRAGEREDEEDGRFRGGGGAGRRGADRAGGEEAGDARADQLHGEGHPRDPQGAARDGELLAMACLFITLRQSGMQQTDHSTQKGVSVE